MAASAFMNEGIDGIILLAQNCGMIRIGRNALDAKQKRVLQRQDIRVDARVGLQPDFFPLQQAPSWSAPA